MKIRLLASLLILTSVLTGQSAVVFNHSGNANPTTEGWSEIGAGIGVTTGPVTNDLGTGLDSWFVRDTSVVTNSAIQYVATPSPTIHVQAATLGWTLSANVRMVESSVGSFGGMFADYLTDTVAFTMFFDREPDGDPRVLLYGHGSYTLDGVGDGAYHLFELVYDPTEGSADLFVDGVERLSNYTGLASGDNRIGWGASGSTETGRGHFNSVSFTVVPEPSHTAWVGILVGATMVSRRRRVLS